MTYTTEDECSALLWASRNFLGGTRVSFVSLRHRACVILMMNVDINWNNNSIKTTVTRGSLARVARSTGTSLMRACLLCTLRIILMSIGRYVRLKVIHSRYSIWRRRYEAEYNRDCKKLYHKTHGYIGMILSRRDLAGKRMYNYINK